MSKLAFLLMAENEAGAILSIFAQQLPKWFGLTLLLIMLVSGVYSAFSRPSCGRRRKYQRLCDNFGRHENSLHS
jgi:hypothetical protein